jgi:mevalonate kinase
MTAARVRASAPGKIILCGEHAVVYGQPALAVPVTQVQATVTIEPSNAGWMIEARDLGRLYRLDDAPADDPVATAIHLTLTHHTSYVTEHEACLTIASTIPIASGLGSGAAVSAAIVRALAEYLGQPLTNAEVSALVFETEKLLHGTPSGIDNTVIAYQRPVYFIKGQPPTPLNVARPFKLLIGDTGISSSTKITVGDVRAAHAKEPERYQQLFNEIGTIANQARTIIESGDPAELGPLMNQNHDRLREIGVSSPELEALVSSARAAGALGAKLSGGGRGGNMIALVTSETEFAVRTALEGAGAKRVIETTVDGGRKTEETDDEGRKTNEKK